MKTGTTLLLPACFRTSEFLVVLTLVGAVVLDPTSASSQGTRVARASHSRERTREYIDDYSNSLGTESDFDLPRASDNWSPAQRQVDLKTLHPFIRTFADCMTQLTFDLNDQTSQIPGLRQLYNEAMRLSGAVVSI